MWQVFNRSKFKDGSNPGDDVAVLMPGKVAAVFDGVSSAQMDPDTGLSGGRIAALAAARALVDAVVDTKSPIDDPSLIATRMNSAVRRARELHHFQSEIATTAAIVIQQQDHFQFLVIGDTIIRLNGETVLSQPLKVDEVSIALRQAYWRTLSNRLGKADDTEHVVRTSMRFGSDYVVREGLLDAEEATCVLRNAEAELSKSLHEIARKIAKRGLASQYQFANDADSELGYTVLNGAPKLGHLLTKRFVSKEIESIEIASDGYDCAPVEASVSAWEAEHAHLEREDPFRLHLVRGVKGSTASEWSDDRTIIVFNNGQG